MKNRPKSYKSMEIYQLAQELVIEIHRMSLSDLPKFESLSNSLFDDFYGRYKKLGAKLYKFRQTVIQKHNIFDDDTEETT